MSRRAKILVGAGIAIGACTVLYLLNPSEQPLMPKCPMKLLTGFDCPGCGFQRALHAALHGRFAEAVRYNLFLLVALPYLAALFVSDVCLSGAARVRWQRATHSPVVIYAYVVLFFVWWVVRNLLGI